MGDVESNLPDHVESSVKKEAAEVKEALETDQKTGLPVDPEKVAYNKAEFGSLADRLREALKIKAAKKAIPEAPTETPKPTPAPPTEPPKPAGGA